MTPDIRNRALNLSMDSRANTVDAAGRTEGSVLWDRCCENPASLKIQFSLLRSEVTALIFLPLDTSSATTTPTYVIMSRDIQLCWISDQ